VGRARAAVSPVDMRQFHENEARTLSGLGPVGRHDHLSSEPPPSASTHEHFGAALSALARLYDAAEKRGDLALAERYAAAVQLLLGAPPAREHAQPPSGRAPRVSTGWTRFGSLRTVPLRR